MARCCGAIPPLRPTRDSPFQRRSIGHQDADLTTIAIALLLIGVLWLATRPYHGVIHDARFYLVQALHQLHPARFADDLYFKFGSQDQYTVFSTLYAPIVAALGVAAAAAAVTIAGQVLWLCTLLYLVRTLMRRWRLTLLSVAAVIALPGSYHAIFGYGEPFATPRLFAEALTMASLGLLLRRRLGWSLAVLAVSTVLHPLPTLSGWAMAAIYLLYGRPLRQAAISAAGLIAVGLAMIGIRPFAGLLTAFDAQWFDVVEVRDSFGLLTSWSPDMLCWPMVGVLLVGLSRVPARPRERRFLGATLAVGVGGLAVTLIGGDVLHNIFIVELQPWRSMWLVTLVAHLYAVPTFLRLARRRADDMPALCLVTGIGTLLVSQFVRPVIFPATAMIALAAGVAAWQWKTGRRLPVPIRAACLTAVAFASAATLVLVYAFAMFWAPWPQIAWHALCPAMLVAAVLVVLGLLLGSEFGRSLPGARSLRWLAVALAPLAVLDWDMRTPWAHFVEAPDGAPAPLADLLPQNGTVYWESGLEMLWFRLQRASFFSCTQGAGALFFRGTAMNYRHREESFWPLHTRDFGENVNCPKRDETPGGRRTHVDLAAVCRREPALDYLVLARPVEDAEAKVWTSPVPFQDVEVVDGKLVVFKTDKFYIYSCRDF